MHKIDRYGVIALVFMAVTFLAVYFWDDRGKTGSTSNGTRTPGSATERQSTEKQAADREAAARLEPRPGSKAPAPAHREAPAGRPTELALTKTGGAPLRAEAQRDEGGVERARENAVPRPLPGEVPSRDEGRRVADAERPAGERGPTGDEDAIAPESSRAPAIASASNALELASPPPAANERTTPAARTYTVAKHDTLERIAARELGDATRWPEIQALNGGLDPRKLWVGKVLTLPGGDGADRPKASVAAPSTPGKTVETAAASSRSYVVQKGDILGTIAQKELGTAKAWSRIAALNPTIDPDRLVPGMKLVLPAGATVQPAREPLELADPSRSVSKSIARADPPRDGGFKVR